MDRLVGSVIWSHTVYDWYALPILALGLAAWGAMHRWRFFVQWLNGIRSGDWPTVSAIVDMADVIEQRQGTGHGDMVYYLATLTYVYRNPEMQTGDYSRLFGYDEEDEARTWASSYKGATVTVHVDPRDPSRSVLRKKDL